MFGTSAVIQGKPLLGTINNCIIHQKTETTGLWRQHDMAA